MALSDNCLSWMEAGGVGFSPQPEGTIRLLKEAAAEIRQLRAERDQLKGELRSIDEALTRRPALADLATRYGKIYRACYMAERAEKAEAACAEMRELCAAARKLADSPQGLDDYEALKDSISLDVPVEYMEVLESARGFDPDSDHGASHQGPPRCTGEGEGGGRGGSARRPDRMVG